MSALTNLRAGARSSMLDAGRGDLQGIDPTFTLARDARRSVVAGKRV